MNAWEIKIEPKEPVSKELEDRISNLVTELTVDAQTDGQKCYLDDLETCKDYYLVAIGDALRAQVEQIADGISANLDCTTTIAQPTVLLYRAGWAYWCPDCGDQHIIHGQDDSLICPATNYEYLDVEFGD